MAFNLLDLIAPRMVNQTDPSLPTLPGPIIGIGGGTWNIDGSVATPVEGVPTEFLGADGQPEINVLGSTGTPSEQTTPPIDTRIPPKIPVDKMPDLSRVQGKVLSAEEYQRSLPYANVPQHKGMFGIKGTLRDILGTVGDTLLIASGKNPIYAPARQNEMAADALLGYGPGKERDAIARMMQVDRATGLKMYNDWQARLNDEATLEARQANNKATALKNSLAAFEDGTKLYANALRGMTQTGRYNPTLLARIQQNFSLPEEFTPPPAFDANWAEPFIRAGTPVSQQENVDISRERLAQQAQLAREAEAGRMARSHPPQGRAVTNVMTYTGEDGYQYTVRSDGTEVRSNQKVAPTGRRSRAVPPKEKQATPGWTVKRRD